MEPRCEVCGVSNKLLLCARCKIVFYCSKDHQSRDWKNHKSHCKFNLRDNSNVSLEMLSHPPDEKTSATIQNSNSEDGNSSMIVFDSQEKSEGKSEEVPEVSSQELNIKFFSEMSLQGDVQVLPPFLHRSSGDVHEDICKNIIRDMNIYGLCVIDNFLGKTKGLTVLDEVIAIHETGVFKDGQLVSSNVKTDLKTIRSDKITWVDGKEPSCSNISYLINQVDTMVMKANTMRNNGKMGDYKINGRTKAMIACYPGNGSHYVKHVDNPNRDGRCITAIYYLNRDWIVTKHGGLLRIFPEGWRSQVADISPVFDRLLLFWSDRRNPHEVQPAHRTRFAITLWYFDATEREEAYKRFQRTKTVSSGDSESIKTIIYVHSRHSQDFIRNLIMSQKVISIG